jgi:hypothetical protein
MYGMPTIMSSACHKQFGRNMTGKCIATKKDKFLIVTNALRGCCFGTSTECVPHKESLKI